MVRSRRGRRKPITKCENVHCDWFCFCFRLWQAGFHLIISNLVISGVGRKWKYSDYSNCDFAYDPVYHSDFWFSQGHRHSYDSTYDFNSIGSENQLLLRVNLHLLWLLQNLVTPWQLINVSHLSSSLGVSTLIFFVTICRLSKSELTRNPTSENAARIVQNIWNEFMLSLFQNLYERNTDNEPHPLKTEQYQLRVALSSLDNAKSARRARWFKSIIVKNPSYKQRHKTNWMDGWHQRNHTHKKDKVNSGPYFIRALQLEQ